jgi:hypothetical protein
MVCASVPAFAAVLVMAAPSPPAPPPRDYRSFSRLTDPQEYAYMLARLPDDPLGIAAIAKQQTIHHNLLAYFHVDPGVRPGIRTASCTGDAGSARRYW